MLSVRAVEPGRTRTQVQVPVGHVRIRCQARLRAEFAQRGREPCPLVQCRLGPRGHAGVRQPQCLGGHASGVFEVLPHDHIGAELPRDVDQIRQQTGGRGADEQVVGHPGQPRQAGYGRHVHPACSRAQQPDVVRVGHRPIQTRREVAEAVDGYCRLERPGRAERDLVPGRTRRPGERQERMQTADARQQREQHAHRSPLSPQVTRRAPWRSAPSTRRSRRGRAGRQGLGAAAADRGSSRRNARV